MKLIESTGVTAFGVHGRQRDERPNHPNRITEIADVVRQVNIPVIAKLVSFSFIFHNNGLVFSGNSNVINEYSDIEAFRQETGASSVMIGRKALSNPSIFRKEGLFSMEEEIHNFLDKACYFDEPYTQTKYVVQRILGSQQEFVIFFFLLTKLLEKLFRILEDVRRLELRMLLKSVGHGEKKINTMNVEIIVVDIH